MTMLLDGKRTVVLGLQPENLERLTAGEPILVNLRNLDPDGPPTDLPDVDLIVAATDTADWRAALARLGVSPT